MLAIGNPFGLDHTLTMGLISGLNRFHLIYPLFKISSLFLLYYPGLFNFCNLGVNNNNNFEAIFFFMFFGWSFKKIIPWSFCCRELPAPGNRIMSGMIQTDAAINPGVSREKYCIVYLLNHVIGSIRILVVRY